jgi:hypothetical protein
MRSMSVVCPAARKDFAHDQAHARTRYCDDAFAARRKSCRNGERRLRPALQPKFVASKTIPTLCDNASTTLEEPNYSPNYTNTPCDQYVVSQCPLGPGQVYVVVAGAGNDGLAAASFGVNYSGSNGAGIDPRFILWTPCADGLAFPNNDGVHGDFPQPGGGLRITWNAPSSCQFESIVPYGVHAVIGVFYVYAYSDDVFRLTPNNNLQTGHEAAVANCAGIETNLFDVFPVWYVENWTMGRVGFGAQSGYTPCPRPLPVVTTTWGKMKSTYKSDRR